LSIRKTINTVVELLLDTPLPAAFSLDLTVQFEKNEKEPKETKKITVPKQAPAQI
jgi:hypothetical protein